MIASFVNTFRTATAQREVYSLAIEDRAASIIVRLDDEDYALLCYQARKVGMSKSELFRNLLYHGSVESYGNYTPKDARRLLAEFCNISNAMGQIAYSARIKFCVDEEDYLLLESSFKALFDTIVNHMLQRYSQMQQSPSEQQNRKPHDMER